MVMKQWGGNAALIVYFAFIVSLLFAVVVGGATWISITLICGYALLTWHHWPDADHPGVWFIGGLVVYGVAVPVLHALGSEIVAESTARTTSRLSGLAVLGGLAGLTLSSFGATKLQRLGALRRVFEYLDQSIARAELLGWTALWICVGVTAVIVVGVHATGIESKMRLVESGNFLFRLQGAFSLVIAFGIAVASARIAHGKKVALFLVVLGLWLFLSSLLLDERDIVLRYLITTIIWGSLVSRYWRQSKSWRGAILVIVMLGSLVLTSASRYGRAGGVKDILSGATGDFVAASNNLATVVRAMDNGMPLKQGSTFVGDIKAVVLGSSIVDSRSNRQNASAWYNRRFRGSIYRSGGGRGFSLVAESFVNFGMIGPLVMFGILGLGIGVLYSYRFHLSGAMILAIIVPGVLYSLRMDFATLLSYTLKQGVVPVLSVCVGSMFLYRVIDRGG